MNGCLVIADGTEMPACHFCWGELHFTHRYYPFFPSNEIFHCKRCRAWPIYSKTDLSYGSGKNGSYIGVINAGLLITWEECNV